jgi:endonuclease/exonuclease/phosphatase (EEP) superfamily protein YafD
VVPGLKPPRRRRFSSIAWLACGFVLACWLAAECASLSYACELVASFRWQLGWFCCACVLALFAMRRPALALIACAAALHFAWPAWKPALASRPPPPSGAPAELRVASANVLFVNPDHEGFRAWVIATKPDVLAVQELMENWRRELDELRDVFPYHVAFPDNPHDWANAGFSLAIYSRFPFESSRVVLVTAGSLPLLEAIVRVGGLRVRVCTVHPASPQNSELWRARNAFLDLVPSRIDWDENSILMADLNTSSGSPAFAKLLEATRLSDSRLGFGRLPTWHTEAPVSGLWVDLDHVLVGAHVHVLERGVSTIPGSDHLAATAVLSVSDR